MLFLARLAGAAQIQKLRAIQADARCAVLQARAGLVRKLNVAKHHDLRTIPRHRRNIAQFGQPVFERSETLFLLAVACQCFCIWPRDRQPVRAVDYDRIAAGHLCGEGIESNYGWDPQRPSYDGRMRCQSAQIGRKPEDLPRVKLGCLRRGQIACDDDHRLR